MGPQITRVNGLYMSSDFAAKVVNNNARLAVHKAQLRATESSLANLDIKRRHAIHLTGLRDNRKNVFRLMDLPEELRRVILEMVVKEKMDDIYLSDMPQDLPAIAAAGNEQLRQETILAILENTTVNARFRPDLQEQWLSTVSFGVLQQAGISPHPDGFSAIRTAELEIYDFGIIIEDMAARLVKRFENLRQLTVKSSAGVGMFELGFDDTSGDALGAKVRECNLGLPSFELSQLRRLQVTVRINCLATMKYNIKSIPEWRSIIEHGCKKMAG
jgi:hypothetical protein